MTTIRILIRAVLLAASFGGSALATSNADFGAVEIRLVAEKPGNEGPRLTLKGTHRLVEVNPVPLLSASDFVGAGEVRWIEGKPGFDVQLTGAGAEKLAKASTENVGKTLALIVDGKLLGTPKILDPIVASGFLLTVDSVASARELVMNVNRALGNAP
jgi:preprotein translocase subunit SecD